MRTVLPEGEAVRNAVKWVSGCLQESHHQAVQKLVNEAILRFDLSPKDADFLIRFYREGQASKDKP